MRRRPERGSHARADRRAKAAPHRQEVSVRALLAIAALAVGIGAASAQTPPAAPSPAPPHPGNANLRAIPDGPGKRVAELQGLDKVTARTQRFYAPVGESTRFGTLEITVTDSLLNLP